MAQLGGGCLPRGPDAGCIVNAVAERPSAEAETAAAAGEVLKSSVPCSGQCTARIAEGSTAVNHEAQRRWAAWPLNERLAVLRRTRHSLASKTAEIGQAISATLQRSAADTLVAELLPLLDAMRFLERRAAHVLAPQKLTKGRPVWLSGVQAEIQRVPLGHILVVGPANFPLFLPGVQIMQALAAGNAVTWKPGVGGKHIASIVAKALLEGGLPEGLLAVTEESVTAAQDALAAQPDKVVFTGSFETGRAVLRTLAETATPAVLELSGSDAVAVLPSANLSAAAKAIAFGLRLNGGEVCMSPRRLFATRETLAVLRPLLEAELAAVPPVPLRPRTEKTLRPLLDEAVAAGARLIGTWQPEAQRPLLLEGARPTMAITRSDVFAPVLSMIEAPSVLHIADLVNDCPYGLTAAIFGSEREARALGEQLQVGTVLVNDLIAPTADPRVPFGGRGRSGFGATRGAEGLLEMTAAKSVLVRRRPSTRHYQPVGAKEFQIFAGMIGVLHGSSLRERFQSLRSLATVRQKQ